MSWQPPLKNLTLRTVPALALNGIGCVFTSVTLIGCERRWLANLPRQDAPRTMIHIIERTPLKPDSSLQCNIRLGLLRVIMPSSSPSEYLVKCQKVAMVSKLQLCFGCTPHKTTSHMEVDLAHLMMLILCHLSLPRCAHGYAELGSSTRTLVGRHRMHTGLSSTCISRIRESKNAFAARQKYIQHQPPSS